MSTTAASPGRAPEEAAEGGRGAPHDPADAAGAEGRRGRTLAVLVPLVVVAAAGVIRFADLGDPPRIYFDEIYYVEDARAWLEHGTEPHFTVHPPLGKLLMAASMAVLGDRPVGWRVPSALAGTATVLLTYLVALRLFRRRGVAALAAFLVAVDGLALTMSRIAMLDAMLAAFVLLAVWLLLVDRDRQWRGAGARLEALPRRSHVPRWLAGLAFGAALATKWSALWPLAAAVAFVAVSELLWRRRTSGSPWTGVHRAAGSVLVTLVVLPAAVYVASYASWFANLADGRHGEQLCPEGVCELSVPEALAAWWDEQLAVARFHRQLDATHPYRSRATAWPTLERPVAYYYESCTVERQAEGTCEVEPGNVAEILGIGNPAVWWLALLAYPFLLFLAVRAADWRFATVLLFLLAQYLPWLLANRPLFFFYMTPVVPFIALSLAAAAGRLARTDVLRWVPAAVALTAFAAFVFWLPIWTAEEMPRSAWQLRMWLSTWV